MKKDVLALSISSAFHYDLEAQPRPLEKFSWDEHQRKVRAHHAMYAEVHETTYTSFLYDRIKRHTKECIQGLRVSMAPQ